jgi:CRISPR-associated protein Cas8a1/Csx13
VLIAIQDGIQNTFLQHGPTCGSRSGERTVTVEINETPVSLTYDAFTSYKHQGWFWLDRDEKAKEKDPTTGKKLKTGRRIQLHQNLSAVSDNGTLSSELHEIDNKLYPGGIVRHDRFGESAVQETDAGLICMHFSLIGCLTLSVNRVTAVLLVPEVRDLLAFYQSRPWLTPRSAKDCRIAGAADAALQAQVRIRARRTAEEIEIPACYAMTCRPTQWNKKQKPRVATTLVPAGSDSILDRFERALTWLPPRLVVPQQPAPKKSRRTKKAKQLQPFWSDSIVRPLIAENLALRREWYRGFVNLMVKINPATNKPYRNQLPFEKGGLHAMTADPEMWDDEGEALVVKAVHEAIRHTLGRIKEETDGPGNKPPSQATKNRWTKFWETMRIALAGAKTANDARHALCNLFSRAGRVPALVDGWQAVLPKLADHRWQLTRDLALLALASYAGRGESDEDKTPASVTEPEPV